MKRFLVEAALVPGARIRLSPEESKHATRVMRLEAGHSLLLTDGKGQEAEAVLLSTDKGGAEVEVKLVRAAATRPFRFELLQGTLKGPRMDWLVEKATELGVDVIRAVTTQFSVAGERSDRWTRVAHAALKQSGNPHLPEFPEVTSLDAALTQLGGGYQGFLLSPSAPESLASAIRQAASQGRGRFILAVGPEGGFSPDEEARLEAAGFRPCRLSAQILRGETAALTAAAIALHALEFAEPGEL